MNILAIKAIEWGDYITATDMSAVLDTFLGILPVALPTVLAITGVTLALNWFRRALH